MYHISLRSDSIDGIWYDIYKLDGVEICVSC